MRLVRTALIVSVMLLGTTSLRAQTAHSAAGSRCGCQECQACQGYGGGACCNSLLPSVTQSLRSALAGIIPGHTGCDARHQIYKAALQRSTFDKKCLLPVAYYSHILPLWSHHRCCCGPVNSKCPTCGPNGMMGEEMIEMQGYPEGVPMEPTPAVEQEMPSVPESTMEPTQARARQGAGRSTPRTRPASAHGVVSKRAPDRVARQDESTSASATLRSLAPLAPTTGSVVRQVSAEEAPARPTVPSLNPLR